MSAQWDSSVEAQFRSKIRTPTTHLKRDLVSQKQHKLTTVRNPSPIQSIYICVCVSLYVFP